MLRGASPAAWLALLIASGARGLLQARAIGLLQKGTGGADPSLDAARRRALGGGAPAAAGPAEADLVLGEPEKPPSPLPLCYHAIVSETCRKVHDGGDGGDLAPELLGDLLSTDESTVRSLFDSLGLGLRGGGVTCEDLCNATAEYFAGLGDLPPSSDVACFAVEGEEAECNVGVGPHDMAKGSKELKEADPDVPIDQSGEPAVDGGERAAQGRLAAALRTAGAAVVAYDSAPGQRHVVRKVEPRTPHSGRREAASRDAALSAPQRYDVVHQVACRVANIFRFFPSCEAVTVTIEPKSVGDRLSTNESRRVSAAIAARHATAKAWESTLLRELAEYHTQPFRQRWFGGAGALSEWDVRQRIVRTLNFVKQQLDFGIHYVYPANSVPGNACQQYTLAFVYKEYYMPRPSGYAESTMPVCDVDPSQKLCAIDSKGKFVVYICEWYDHFADWKKVGTILHEVVHHTNVNDVTYDESVMVRLSQAQQLDNADNYAHFGSDVVQSAWNCDEVDHTHDLPFSCPGGQCTCSMLSAFCDHRQLGAEVKRQCPATCGACVAPPVKHPHPAVVVAAPAPTRAPAPPDHARCTDSEDTNIRSRSTGKTYTCEQLAGFCEHASWGKRVSLVCPKTCEACPPATCADVDASHTDLYGDHCGAYWGEAGWCGNFDDEDFSSNNMCCACKAA
mmetsp:Transcript_115868/g.314583  ORF Transcript_115868/g.314583 Transcript_115868/m.314583 type:complete len:678 (-) Transcript_115868:71-2104(-)